LPRNKRLSDSRWVDLDRGVVCTVGPNAAGRSSFDECADPTSTTTVPSSRPNGRARTGSRLDQVHALRAGQAAVDDAARPAGATSRIVRGGEPASSLPGQPDRRAEELARVAAELRCTSHWFE
jgi:hypothetical protein